MKCIVYRNSLVHKTTGRVQHIPGVVNEDADRVSRKQELRIEWMLNRRDFHYVTEKLHVSPSVYLFAS